MNILIDHTGLHSAYNCFEKNLDKEGSTDCKNFIQLVFEIIFCEKIHINAIKGTDISLKAEEIFEKFTSIGLEKDTFVIKYLDEIFYREICQISAVDATSSVLTQNFKSVNMKSLVPNLSSKEAEINENFHKLIINKLDEKIQKEILEYDFKTDGSAAVHYMFAYSENLRKKIYKKIKSYPDWSIENTYKLISFLRYHLTENIAKSFSLVYAPNITRAESIRESNENFFKCFSSKILPILKPDEVTNYTFDLPDLIIPIIVKAKYEPKAIIAEALNYRLKSKSLRKYLEVISTKFQSGKIISKKEANNEIKDIISSLKRALHLEKSTTIFECLSLKIEPNINLGIPTFGVSVFDTQNIAQWFSERIKQRKIKLFTELSKEVLISGARKEILKTFHNNNLKNN